MNREHLKRRSIDFCVAVVAVLAGAAVVYVGDRLLGVRLELYYGISTYTIGWVLAVFLVPFLAGIVVSMIYGLGGKILAHFSPLIVRAHSYIELQGATVEGAHVLPLGYWIFMVILCVEFATVGGVVGEVLVKKTYGRTDKRQLYKLHKKYEKPGVKPPAEAEVSESTER